MMLACIVFPSNNNLWISVMIITFVANSIAFFLIGIFCMKVSWCDDIYFTPWMATETFAGSICIIGLSMALLYESYTFANFLATLSPKIFPAIWGFIHHVYVG